MVDIRKSHSIETKSLMGSSEILYRKIDDFYDLVESMIRSESLNGAFNGMDDKYREGNSAFASANKIGIPGSIESFEYVRSMVSGILSLSYETFREERSESESIAIETATFLTNSAIGLLDSANKRISQLCGPDRPCESKAEEILNVSKEVFEALTGNGSLNEKLRILSWMKEEEIMECVSVEELIRGIDRSKL